MKSDFAIVVISASLGEFEAGICKTGQIREHITLATTYGLRFLNLIS
jgi:translation elongation factor EF-1alpha